MPDQGSQLDRGEGTAQDQSSSWPNVCDSLCLVSFLFLMAAASPHFSLWLLLHCQVPVSLLTIQAGCVLVQNLKEDVAWLTYLPSPGHWPLWLTLLWTWIVHGWFFR